MAFFAATPGHQKGQGLVEYALILVLVAVVVIVALMVLGPIIGNTFSTINSSITSVGAAPAGPAGYNCSDYMGITMCQYDLPGCGGYSTVTCDQGSHPVCLNPALGYYSCN